MTLPPPPDYYFYVSVAPDWEQVLDIAAKLVAQWAPETKKALELGDASRTRCHLTEISGARYPRRTRGSVCYEILTTAGQSQTKSGLRTHREFTADIELYKDQCWLFLTDSWLSMESHPYLDFGASDGRKCLGRLNFWTTLDFLATVECGRTVLPIPKSTRSLGESAEFDPMPWAVDFRFSVERRDSVEASDYVLECGGIKIIATIEPHLDHSHMPNQHGVDPIKMARTSPVAR